MGDAHTPVTMPATFGADGCTVKDILERVGDKWTILTLAALERRPWRFRELQRAIDGISQRMLTVTLRRLERDGLVSRTVQDTRPPQVEYNLTDLGRTLTGPLRTLADWSANNRDAIADNRRRWDDKAAGTTSPRVGVPER